jgi:uncharacterized membrane protein
LPFSSPASPAVNYDHFVAGLTRAIELAGIFALLAGGLLATGAFVREVLRRRIAGAYEDYRANLGRAILLGLEILIIADIIGTIAVEPNLENLSVLGLIVLIRTFLSFALEVEITGRLPWRADSSRSS